MARFTSRTSPRFAKGTIAFEDGDVVLGDEFAVGA
jgi:hypothetical protein